MRRVLVAALSVAALGAGGAQVALATGQPNQDCGTVQIADQPAGFQTQGFSNAESHYAGSDGTPSLAHAQSSAAVSQYDVACVKKAAH
jgi:hypothetical protein